MLENQPKRSITDEPSTIIIPIPARPADLSGDPLMVTVKGEREEPIYFTNNNDLISSQDFLEAINTRLRQRQWSWIVLILGLVLSAGFASIQRFAVE